MAEPLVSNGDVQKDIPDIHSVWLEESRARQRRDRGRYEDMKPA